MMARWKNWKMAGVAAAVLLAVQPVVADTAGGHADDEAALRAQAADYAKSYAAGDSKTLANMWTADGTYTDPDGDQLTGRQRIQSFFDNGFQNGGAQKMEIAVDSIKFPSDNVAIEEGICTMKGGAADGDTSRYTVVHVKDKVTGKWLMANVSESNVRNISTDSLNDLGWLVGKWTAKGPKGTMQFRAAWAGDHKFIECAYGTDAATSLTDASTQVIGWNPRTNRVISWHFGEHGGYGFGTFRKNGDTWVERAFGIQPDGNVSSGSYVLHKLDTNKFTWRSTDRKVGGVPVPATQEIVVTRDGTSN